MTGKVAFFLLLTPYLAACSAPTESGTGEGPPDPEQADVSVPATVEVLPREHSPEQERLLADLLFEGLQALDADRLLAPVDDNAHARFKRVLAYDPDNEIALQGLQDIVLRYAELAEEAARRGVFDQAESYLERARFVDRDHPAIADAESTIAEERESGDFFYELNSTEVLNRSDALRSQLARIAETAREHEAFILIAAPSDAEGRWIYNAMREAVDGYRLRGNIELASRYGIRLRLP